MMYMRCTLNSLQILATSNPGRDAVSEYVVYDSSMCESHCLMRMSVAPLSDVKVTVGE